MRIVAVLLALLGVHAQAFELPWKTPIYTLRAQDTRTGQLLRDFCSIQGMRVVVNERVDGEISGVFDQIPPDIFLDQICKANGLTWFYDGQMLFIDRDEDVRSDMLPLSPAAAARVSFMLDQMGAKAHRMEIKPLPDQNLTLVSGPPRFFELVRSFAVNNDQRKEATVVQVFPLKYAWAYDLDFNFRDEQVTVPGVATVLQNISASGETARMAISSPGTIRSSTQPRLKGKGLAQQSAYPSRTSSLASATLGLANDKSSNNAPSSAAAPATQADSVAPRNGPQIYADVRLNAVVIRDTRENLDAMATIIRTLDAPTSLVEITAAIVDVGADAARTIGTDFLLGKTVPNGVVTAGFDSGRDASSGSSGTNTGTNSLNIFGPGGVAANAGNLIPGTGGSASALIINNGWQFLARIRAMEEAGKAKILSRPSVLTLDNVEATLKNDDTIYVRVAGREEVDLFNVTAGVTLQVTPHVIEGEGTRRMKLVLNIEDGNFTQESVDQIPTVRKSNINTQATILENQSLLVGGYTNERILKLKRQVPVLGQIPLVGYLFKRDATEKKRMERMFLITPRVVNLDYNDKKDVDELMKDFGKGPIPVAPSDKTLKAPVVDALAAPVLFTRPETLPVATPIPVVQASAAPMPKARAAATPKPTASKRTRE